MSADNQIQVIKFRKATGEVVWRVFETTLSGYPFEIVQMMSNQATECKFLEFAGDGAFNKALAAANKMEDTLPTCEYGVSFSSEDSTPVTFQDCLIEAGVAGYPQVLGRAASELELTDQQRSQLPNSWLVQQVTPFL